MIIFSQGVLHTPKLQRLELTEEDDEGHWEGSLNSTIQKLFVEMVCADLPKFLMHAFALFCFILFSSFC